MPRPKVKINRAVFILAHALSATLPPFFLILSDSREIQFVPEREEKNRLAKALLSLSLSLLRSFSHLQG